MKREMEKEEREKRQEMKKEEGDKDLMISQSCSVDLSPSVVEVSMVTVVISMVTMEVGGVGPSDWVCC